MTKSYEWRGPDQAVTLVAQTDDGPKVIWEGMLTARKPLKGLPDDHPYVSSWLAIGHLVEIPGDPDPTPDAVTDPDAAPAPDAGPAPDGPSSAPEAGPPAPPEAAPAPRKSRQKEG